MSLTLSSSHIRRRRGQALLLAVLLMVFAALLAAAFVTVVALNLSQTARQSDKNRAIQAAQAGLSFVNRRLTYSENGERWRPENDSPIPLPAAPEFPIYYTNFDRAQGWAGQFAKFPDPRRPADDAPQFMAHVEQVLWNIPTTDPEHDKAGALKITVIGLAPDDPAVFHRLVAYKGGVEAAPLGQVMRGISNWDFKTKTVPVAQVASYAAPTITLKNARGNWPAPPFTIMIGDPQSGSVRGATVSAVGMAGGSLTLADTPATPVANERVELAAVLGAGSDAPGEKSAVDFDNSGTADLTDPDPNVNELVSYRVSRSGTTAGSVRANGGLWWQGSTSSLNLRASSDAYGASLLAPGTIRASGLMALGPTTSSDVALRDTAMTSDATLVATSADSNFPGTGGGWGTLTDPEKDALVSDGWNRLSENRSARRSVKPFSPPDLTAGEDGFGRYRRLTKFSNPDDTTHPLTASGFGLGEGIYLDNFADRERIYDTAAMRFKDMTQPELLKMWLSPTGATEAFTREATLNAVTHATTSTTASLEEKHLRGWVGPDEFRARGALVELMPETSEIAITLEHRTDTNTPNSKGWRDENGILRGDSLQGGVYRKVLPWPENGVLFAEGNLRIRGGVDDPDGVNTTVDPGRSLTIVSMGNIYIEGSINAGGTTAGPTMAGRKLLLLARKNVVVNPTRVVERVDAQTRAAVVPAGPQTTIEVYDASVFQKGDWIRNTTTSESSRLTDVDTTTNILTLETAISATQNDLIATLTDPRQENLSIAPLTDRSQISTFGETLQRRFPTNGQNNVRLALRHSAERRDAFSIGFTGGAPTSAILGMKRTASPQNQVVRETTSEKRLIITQSTPGTDTFPGVLTSNLAALKTEMDSVTPNGAPPPTWRYDTSVETNFGTAPIPLYHFLAGVGNRKDVDGTTGAFGGKEIVGVAGSYKIPLATSLTATFNDTTGNAVLKADHWGTGLEGANQLGFSFVQAEDEDVLTSDQSFYTPYIAANPITYALDSRVITDPAATPPDSGTLALRFNDAVAALFPTDPTLPAHLPFYRLSRVKVENNALDNGAGAFQEIEPGQTLDIRAFVYAQEGSWFVIPGPSFDADVKNNDDTNRDGTMSADEAVAGYRFHRFNYAISFRGAIMENQTAIINTVGSGANKVEGAVQDWTDKWATYSGPTTPKRDIISYTFDDAVVLGKLANDTGFRLPQSLELIYQD